MISNNDEKVLAPDLKKIKLLMQVFDRLPKQLRDYINYECDKEGEHPNHIIAEAQKFLRTNKEVFEEVISREL